MLSCTQLWQFVKILSVSVIVRSRSFALDENLSYNPGLASLSKFQSEREGFPCKLNSLIETVNPDYLFIQIFFSI